MSSGVSITLISCKVILSGRSREGTENRLIIRTAVQDAYTDNGIGNLSAFQFSLQTGAMWNSMGCPFCHCTAEMWYLVAVYTLCTTWLEEHGKETAITKHFLARCDLHLDPSHPMSILHTQKYCINTHVCPLLTLQGQTMCFLLCLTDKSAFLRYEHKLTLLRLRKMLNFIIFL